MIGPIRWGATPPPGDPLGPGSPDPDAIREVACRLTAPDRDCTTPTPSTPQQSAGADGGSALAGIVELLVWVLFVGLVAVLVVLAVRAILLRQPSRRRRAASDTADDEPEVVPLGRTLVDHRRSPADWRAEADEHRRAGRHRDALRCRYRALVGDLARRDVIDEVPGRTTGEERRQLAASAPASSASFAAAADLFDGAWYGDAAIGEADVERMIELESDVLQRAGAR